MNNKSREESFTDGFLHGSNDYIELDSDRSNDTAYQEGCFWGEEIMDLENGESSGGEEFISGAFLLLFIILAGIFIANHLVFVACIGVLAVSVILLMLIKNDSIKLAPGESQGRKEKTITRSTTKQKNNQSKRQSKKPPRKIYEINISSDCYKSKFFCSKCVEICPEGIFKNTKLPEWKYSIILTTPAEERCTGCNACVEACPIGAITINKIRKTENDLERERQERKNAVASWLNENRKEISRQ